MYYIDALNLIKKCIEHDILKTKDDNVIVKRKNKTTLEESWFLESKEDLAQELMKNENGQSLLIEKLKTLGVDFEEEYRKKRL